MRNYSEFNYIGPFPIISLPLPPDHRRSGSFTSVGEGVILLKNGFKQFRSFSTVVRQK